ncbi:MAG: HlyD family secretion protein [Bacteroidia bacterium]|jgi:multidrug efflux pump subunit AcrA (membrane-fusion protein)|nr:HlyD family secretion protein [Bacteroidia bacterium]
MGHQHEDIGEDLIRRKRFQAVTMVRNPRLSKRVAQWCVAILFVLILSMFLPWTQNIGSYGKITSYAPQDRPQELQSVIAGQIAKWYVREGQYVKKGDTIVRLTEVKEKFLDTNLVKRLGEQISAKQGSRESYAQKVSALGTQIRALQSAQVLSLQKADNKLRQARLKVISDSTDVVAAFADYEIAVIQQQRADSLFKKGLISLTDLERRRLKVQETQAKRISSENKLLISRNEQLNALIELGSIEAEYLDKISKAESELNTALSSEYEAQGEISKLSNEYRNMQLRQGFYAVTAPQDGYLVQVKKQGVGETVKEGDVIATIMPANAQLAVELYVQPMDIPLLAKGRKVRLQFDGWPALVFNGWPNYSFGTFGGVVAVIDNIDTKGQYRILVIPDPEDDPWPKQLRVGSGVYGWALLKDVPVWYELWRQMNGFPPDYMGDLKEEADKEYKKAKDAATKDE